MKGSSGRRQALGTSRDRRSPRQGQLSVLSPQQQELLDAQQSRPDVPLTVSHYVDATGKLDLAALKAASSLASREFGCQSLLETQNVVLSHIDQRGSNSFEILDLRAEADPGTAARNWMQSESADPMNPSTDQLARWAVLVLADEHWYWYVRAHRIALDVAGARSMMIRAAEIYTALAANSTPDPAELPRPTVDTEVAYRVSKRWSQDQKYWDATLAGAPVRTSLAAETATAVALPSVRSGTVPRHVIVSLESIAEAESVSLSTVLIASFALYLGRLTGSDDVVLRIPMPAPTSSTARVAGAGTSNIVPLRVMIDPHCRVGELVRAVKVELVGALRHRRFRDQQSLHAPTLTLNLFPSGITLGDALGELQVASVGPVDDLEVTLSVLSETSGIQVDFAAHPDLYPEATLTGHHRSFLEFLTMISSGDEATHVADVDPRADATEDPVGLQARNLMYWREALSTPVPALGLIPAGTGERSSAPIVISPQLFRGLESLAASMCTSMFVLYHAAVAGLLRRRSSSSEVSIGIPLRGYGAPSPDNFASMYAHHVVLRSSIDTAESLTRLIERTDDAVVDALIHADIRLSSVAAALDAHRSLDYGPLFRTLVFAQTPMDTHPRFRAVMGGLPVGFELAEMPELYFALPTRTGNARAVGYVDCIAPSKQARDLAVGFARILRAMVEDSAAALGTVDLAHHDL
ncbi:condensation domain-containing protein [Rhodococcus sp. NPDC056743]|uniref:condensation domain-containing protein n=1 Tax=Rhodococcus sp. NPDC056743 TaxID=3345934 RepID=UPI0036709DBD